MINKRIFEIPIKLQKQYMLIELIEKYLAIECTGGSLHVLLDDGNFGESTAKFCKEYAIKHKDYWGEIIATLLMEFTEEEQIKIVDRPHEIFEEIENL